MSAIRRETDGREPYSRITMDIVSREKRSSMMSGIRSKDTKPEMKIRKALYSRGYRYRLHSSKIHGKPDIIMRKYNAVIFIHGCFWHGHNCKLFRLPKTRTAFWGNKINTNRKRDRQVISMLQKDGWRIAVIWECSMRGKGKMNFEDMMDRLTDWIESDSMALTLTGEEN